MEINRNLTKVHEERIQQLAAQSPAGMAHWAGTGPANRTCRECKCFEKVGYCSGSNKLRPNALKDGPCRQFKRMMQRSGPAIPPTTQACKFFDENPNPPMLRA